MRITGQKYEIGRGGEWRWCGRRDLNPHDLRHQVLNLACLPVPPRPPISDRPAPRRGGKMPAKLQRPSISQPNRQQSREFKATQRGTATLLGDIGSDAKLEDSVRLARRHPPGGWEQDWAPPGRARGTTGRAIGGSGGRQHAVKGERVCPDRSLGISDGFGLAPNIPSGRGTIQQAQLSPQENWPSSGAAHPAP